MEVEVRSHEGIPTSSVISIRAGKTRRQAHIAQLDRAFKYPMNVEECSAVKVDILDLAGSARIACKPGVNEYSIPLETVTAGGGYTGMAVDIRLKPLAGGGEVDSPMHGKKQSDAKAYLEQHGVTGFMQFIIQSLMKDKPDDPYAFLQRQITKRMMDRDEESSDKHESQLEDLIAQLSQPTSDWVSEEQLEDLEKKAERAAQQLRTDNEEMAATSAKMKNRYKALVVAGEPAPPSSNAGDAQLDMTFSSLSAMQRDVTDLTQENATLVSELVRIREAVQSMQDEVDGCKA